MRTKEFEKFINKTSKIVERALDSELDVLGASLFFEEISGSGDGDEMKGADYNMQYKERLVPLFTFQDNEPTKRTITSIEWMPKVSFEEKCLTLVIEYFLGERFANVYLQ